MDIYVFPWLRKHYNRIKFYFVDFKNPKLVETTQEIIDNHTRRISIIENPQSNFSHEETVYAIHNGRRLSKALIESNTDRQLEIIKFRRILLYRLLQSFFNIIQCNQNNIQNILNDSDIEISANIAKILRLLIESDIYLKNEYNIMLKTPINLFLTTENQHHLIHSYTIDDILEKNKDIHRNSILLIRDICTVSDLCSRNTQIISNLQSDHEELVNSWASNANFINQEIADLNQRNTNLRIALENLQIDYNRVLNENKEFKNTMGQGPYTNTNHELESSELFRRMTDLQPNIVINQVPNIYGTHQHWQSSN